MKVIKIFFLLTVLINSDSIYAGIKSNVNLKFILYDGLTSINTAAVQQKLNDNADRILSDLQVENVDTIRVHIWGRNDSFLAAQTRYAGRNWPGSSGFLISPNDLGILNVGNISEIAEHEFVHCVTTHVTSLFSIWIWEAVAVYEANEFVNPKSLSYLVSGDYPTITELNQDLATGSRKIYQVGYLIIEFIRQQWGKETVLSLLRSGGNIHSTLSIPESEFEQQWKNFVNDKYFKATFVESNASIVSQKEFVLYQNYPNPFNPETVISYKLSGTSHVELKVFDALGSVVATLVDKEQHAGIYKVKFDSHNLVSGIYMYRLNTGTFSETNKMILLK